METVGRITKMEIGSLGPMSGFVMNGDNAKNIVMIGIALRVIDIGVRCGLITTTMNFPKKFPS